jgi:hypothetical protein
VDLRFARQVVVNPESKTIAANVVQRAPLTVAQRVPRHVGVARKKH